MEIGIGLLKWSREDNTHVEESLGIVICTGITD